MALYLHMSTNIPHPELCMDRARCLFLIMFSISKLSKHKVSWFLTNFVESLFRKSLRWLAIFSWHRAKVSRDLFLFLLPFFFFECWRLRYFKWDRDFCKCLG